MTADAAADTRTQLETRLVPLLACTECHQQVRLATGAVDTPLTFRQADERLVCVGCDAEYPVTDDHIPIMWSASLASFFRTAEGSDVLAANVELYDEISEDYSRHSRVDPDARERLVAAVRRVLPGARLGALHLDFGCGPGHVLSWTTPLGLRAVGLDVSLKNLRMARRATNALVVCGDATALPFRDGTFALVTEASALHHIVDWERAVEEACRVVDRDGGVVFDAEPSREQVAWGALAVAAMNVRFPVYRVLSRVWKEKYLFRDIDQARKTLAAEVHHQPGTGIDVEAMAGIIRRSGFVAEVVRAPTRTLEPGQRPNKRALLLSVLSARNPWDPAYGAFTAMGHRRQPADDRKEQER